MGMEKWGGEGREEGEGDHCRGSLNLVLDGGPLC